ncbi:ABC-type transport auxiliary lipoprotein family protein [Limoniibacter endophyticus]|nr:ABC-type transport auxiliary lipoprotein family protein [Limoniibacter endophyticus]
MVKTSGLVIAILLAGNFLSGCALLGAGPAALDTFSLSSPASTYSGGVRSGVQLLVTEPTALKAYDGERIVVQPRPTEISYLSGAQWADRLPPLVQAKLIETLQKADKFRGVGKSGEGLAIDYQVQTEIRAFDVAVDNGNTANVEIYARLLNDRNGQVAASRSFTARASMQAGGNDAYANAIDRAFAQVAVELTQWVIDSL